MPKQGARTPKAVRRKIGQSQAERHRRNREQAPLLRRGRKRCNGCGEWKVFDLDNLDFSDFGCSKQRRKDNTISEAPQSECRLCHAKKQRKRQVGRKRAKQTITPERRRYNTEWQRWKRATERGEYHPRPIPPTTKRVYGPRRVDARPFLAWMEEWCAVTGTDELGLCRTVMQLPESQVTDPKDLQRAIYRWRHESPQVHIRFIDLFATAMGMPDQVAVLYPLD